MDYPAWRVTFQSSEQAARAAFNELLIVKGLLAEARQDAERYRWMRDDVPWLLTSGSDGTRITAYMMGINIASIGPDSDEFDAAIDAAMKGANA